MTVTFDSVESLDADTVTHSALIGDMTYADGEFLINVLYFRDEIQSPVETSGVWELDFATLFGPFSSPFKWMYSYYRPRATNGSDDNHTWTFDPAVEATSVAVVAHAQGLEYLDSDFNEVEDPSLDVDIAGEEGPSIVTVLFLWSPTGTTCNGDLIIRTDGASMPAGHGTVEAWAYQGPGPHTVDADALTGDIDLYYWIELRQVGGWINGLVQAGELVTSGWQ